MIRQKKELYPINVLDFANLVKSDSRFTKIILMIKQIDPDRNGYITNTELDDMIKIVYPELENSDLHQIIKPFCSLQNRVLVNYKEFQQSLL